MPTTLTSASQVRSSRDQAIAKAKAGDLAQSLSICEQIIRDSPQNSIGLRTLADCYEIAGDKVEACRQLRLSIDLGIALVADHCKLGYWLIDLGEYGEAVRNAESALGLADDDELAYFGEALKMQAGYAALRAGDAAVARAYAEQCAADAEEYFSGVGLLSRDRILVEASRLP